jgi:hypothetical protein
MGGGGNMIEQCFVVLCGRQLVIQLGNQVLTYWQQYIKEYIALLSVMIV